MICMARKPGEKGPPRLGWSAAEVERVTTLLDKGLSMVKIGDQTRLGTHIVQRIIKAHCLGDKLRSRRWTPAELAKLVELYEAGHTRREIAGLMRRTVESVQGAEKRAGLARKVTPATAADPIDPPAPPKHTRAVVGSAARIELYRHRLAEGFALFHPDDCNDFETCMF
jgi:hypothetical protein